MVAPAVEMDAVHARPHRIEGLVVEGDVVDDEVGQPFAAETEGGRVAQGDASEREAVDAAEVHQEAVVALGTLGRRRQLLDRGIRLADVLLEPQRRILAQVVVVPHAAGHRHVAVAADGVAVGEHGAAGLRREADSGKAVEPQLLAGSDAEGAGYEVFLRRRRQVDAGRAGVETPLDCRGVVVHAVADEVAVRRQDGSRKR